MDINKKTYFCPVCRAKVAEDVPVCPVCTNKLLDGKHTRTVNLEPTDIVDGYETVPRALGLKRKVSYEAVPDEKFLRGYSFGPGCGFYFLNRIFWPYYFWGFIIYIFNRLMQLASRGATYEEGFVYSLIAVVPCVVFLVMVVSVGRVSRKKRWELLPWRSFSHFRSAENDWNILGIVGWAEAALIVVAMIAAALYYSQSGP
jgi:hypothetical protein